MADDQKETSFVVGFFAGALLGVAGALLLAPKPGRKLRKGLSKEGRRLMRQVSESAGEMKDTGTDAYEVASEALSRAARGLRDAAQSLSR